MILVAKGIERLGRRLLLRAVATVFAARPARVALPRHRPPKILVVRLDERVGNLLLTTPLLLTLARRYPGAQIDCVVANANAVLLRGLAFVHHVHGFAKWNVFGRRGFVALARRLRRARYDLCIDAANPSQPSVTQALLVRAVAAEASVGYARCGFGRLYSAPVALAADAEACLHEIELRLALLAPLGAGPTLRTMAVALPWPPPSRAVAQWLEAMGGIPYVVVNLGARLAQKRLRAADYAMVANACTALGLRAVLVWGPQERPLLAPVLRLASDAVAAPPTTLQDLACLLRGATAVVTADTGPMHLAVALGRPTCGLFVSTSPQRYGHAGGSHRVVDTRRCSHADVLAVVRTFLQQRRVANAAAPPPRGSRRAATGEVAGLHLGAAQVRGGWREGGRADA